MNIKLLALFVIGVIIAVFFLNTKVEKAMENRVEEKQAVQESNLDCTPTFPDGGGPYYLANVPFRAKLAPENSGTRLIVKGKVLQRDCKTVVGNAVLDIWHADSFGNYQNDWYRGKVRTNSEGGYSFETVVPKGYGEGTGYRPPHIHFKIFINEKEIITSQMFFPDVKGRKGFNEAYIMKYEEKKQNGEVYYEASHDIILP